MAGEQEQGVLVVLTGLPASGKTTVARKLEEEREDLEIISSDSIRRKGKPSQLWERMLDMVEEELGRDRVVMVDATNYTKGHRERFISAARESGCPFLVVCFKAKLESLLSRNLLRDEKIPSDAIRRLAKLFEEPEGENVLIVDTEEMEPQEASQILDKRIRELRS